MRRNKTIALFIATLCAVTGFAGNVTPETAKQIAKQFADRHLTATRAQQADPELVYIGNNEAYFAFNIGSASYVIVSGNDIQEPVLGYSDNGTFPTDGNLPENMTWWLSTYEDGSEPIVTRADGNKTSVSPLLGDIMWNQDEPYNNKCPLIDGKRTATCCTATSFAQVMKFHSYPEKGTGSISYTSNRTIEVSCDFSSLTFDWTNMLPTYTAGNYNETQADAVATLMFACGASIKTSYGITESAAVASNILQALFNNFGYDHGAKFMRRAWYTNSEWMSMVKNELSLGRPIIYGGNSASGGHSFVIDGYDSNDYIHVNWGWNGKSNGYFRITKLNPSSVGTGAGDGAVSGYNISQTMITNVQRPTAENKPATMVYAPTITVTKKKDIALGETIGIAFSNLQNFSYDFTGTIAPLLLKDGAIVSRFSGDSLKTESFKATDKIGEMIDVALPTTLPDGNYSLRLGVRRDGDKEWTIVKTDVGSQSNYEINVENGVANIVVTKQTYNLGVDFSLKHTYAEVSNEATVTINNPDGEDIYGTLALLYEGKKFDYGDDDDYWFDDEDEYDSGYAEIGGIAIDKDMTSQTFTGSLSLSTDKLEGNSMYIGIKLGDGTVVKIGESKEFNLSKPKTPSATNDIRFVVYPNIDKKSYAPGETIKLNARIALTEEEMVYYGTWSWNLYSANGGSSPIVSQTEEIFLENGNVHDTNVEFNTTALSPGTYFIAPFAKINPNDANRIQIIKSDDCPIFDISEATGIDDTSAEANSLVIYPQPVEETLNMRSPAEAQSVDIYDISGRRVVSQSLGGGRSHSVGVGSLTAGTYIINVNCGGKIYKEKFVKR